MPARAQRKIERAAAALPWPELDSEGIGQVAPLILELQNGVHADFLANVGRGRFTFLNRTVDFGSVEGVEWRRDLGEANNPLWRMNLSYFGWCVPLLERGDAEDLATVRTLVASLESQNGFEEPGVFRDVWNAYSASHRCINLLVGSYLYCRRGGAERLTEVRPLLEHARFCAAFVRHSLERELQYNHLLKNYVALLVYASACGAMPTSFAFVPKAARKCLADQLLADGGQAERAPMYHLLSVIDVRVLLATGVFAPADAQWLEQADRRMTEALAAMCHPDGDVSLFNDSWLGEGPKAERLLDVSALPQQIQLPQTGYTRLAGGADCVILDHGFCGPDDNPGHAHADFLSLESSVNGRRFIVDPGVPTYTMGELRDRSRSAAWHNGPHVIGVEPIDFWASFRVGRRGYAFPLPVDEIASKAPLHAAGWHNGYAPLSARLARYVALWPGAAILIVDLWEGPVADKARVSWRIDGEWAYEDGRFSVGDREVTVSVLRGSAGSVVPAPSWRRFGEERASWSMDVDALPCANGAVAATLFEWGSDFVRPSEDFVDSVAAALHRNMMDGKGAAGQG